MAEKKHAFGIGDHVELAGALVRALGTAERLVFDEGGLYRYAAATGLWGAVEEADGSRILQTFSGLRMRSGRPLALKASDVRGAWQLAAAQVSRPGFFAGAPRGLAFANGFVTVGAEGILRGAHQPSNGARVGYPFAYKPGSSAVFLRFLDDLFRDDSDKAEKISCLQEALGAALIGEATRYQRCLFLVGDGQEGKSSFAEIIRAQFPAGTVSSVPPQNWGDQYRRAMLRGKLLNFVTELPNADILNGEAFKAIISGDTIDARPIREPPFNFEPRAGQVFALNALPGTNDQSRGFWRRPIVIRFNRRFDGADRDHHIASRIIATECAGIVAWLLAGAARLVAEGDYTIPASHVAETAAWRLSADQVAMYIDSQTRPLERGEGGIYAARLYAHYRGWAYENGHKEASSTKFGTRVKAILREKRLPDAARTERGVLYPLALGRAAWPVGTMHALKGDSTGRKTK